MIMPATHVTVILNEFLLCESLADTEIIVAYPPLGKLFSIDLSEHCNIRPVAKEEYKAGYRKLTTDILNDISVLKKEVPTYLDFRTCFFASSVILPENYDELDEVIREGISRDLLKGVKPLFIGYDTNSLRFRTNKIIEKFVGKRGVNNIGYCLSDGVRKELVHQWDKKYSNNDLSTMRSKLPFTSDFFNQPPKDARMARLGAVEYKYITTVPGCEEVHSKRLDDSAIIQSYKNYEMYHNVDLFMISGDNNFIEMAHEERMQGIYIKQPKHILSEITTDWYHLVDLIYVCAVVFGYIEINGIGIKGIWTGKSASDWDVCNMKVEIESGNGNKNECFLDMGFTRNVIREMNILTNGGNI